MSRKGIASHRSLRKLLVPSQNIIITARKQLTYSLMARLVVQDEELVRWFLAHGSNPNASAGLWDFTPLSYAIAHAPLSTINLLFDHGGSVSRGQLVNHAAWRTDAESVPILQYVFDHGAPINNSQWEDCEGLRYNWAKSVYGTTPLYNAATQGNVEAVKWLLEHGADRHKRNLGGIESLPTKTALDAVLEEKTPDHAKIVKLLKEEPTRQQEAGPTESTNFA